MARWKKIPGYEDRYEVSNEGQIRSCDMEVNAAIGARAIRKGRVLAPVVKCNGYHYVTLTSADGWRDQIAIHRLVLLAFKGVVTSYAIHARHRDNNRANNWLRNLRIGTAKQNCEDKVGHGTNLAGEKHPMAKLTEAQARSIKFAPTRAMAVAIAVAAGICEDHADNIRRGKSWKHLK